LECTSSHEKIDLVGEKDRGFAMGLNEFAGSFLGRWIGFAFLTGFIANNTELLLSILHWGNFFNSRL